MKKILCVLLSFIMMFSIVACKDTTQNVGDVNSGVNSENTDNTSTDSGKTETPVGALAYDEFKNVLSGKTFLNETGSADNSTTHIVKQEDNGFLWRYVYINANKSGEAVNVLQLSDTHIVQINDTDRTNPVTMSVFNEHSGGKEGMGISNFEVALQYPQYFDYTVHTGDFMDYLAYGGLEYLKANLFSKGNILAALGNHDIARNNNGSVADTSTLENRYEQLKNYWPNDTDYASVIVKNSVMLIQLDNAQSKYYGEQATKLSADLEKARQNNLTVLIFQHMPISVNDPQQSRVAPIRDTSGTGTLNFQKALIGGSKYVGDDVTKEVYNLITENADVVKGVFCGHEHADYYSEIHGSYTKDGVKTEAIIPQYVMSNNYGDKGHALAIMVR